MATQIIDLGKIRFSWQGAWSSSTEYELNDVVRYGGNLYAYIFETPNTNIAPTDTDYWSLIVNGTNYRGTYNNSTAYAPGDVVTYGGPGYICIAATTGNLPSNAVYWALFTDGFSWLGEYSALATYKKNDVVKYSGSNYIAKSTTTGNLPTDITYWDIFSEGYPDPTQKSGWILTNNGSTVSWTDTPSLDTITAETKFTSESATYIGAGAESFETSAALTDAAIVIDTDGGPNSFAQLAFHNAEPTSSTDIIAYGSNGNDSYGWVGMGITGDRFDDTTYGITGQGDSYIFSNSFQIGSAKPVTNKALSSNVATLTSAAHGFLAGQRVLVSGVDSTFNGAYTITSVTTNTFSYAKTYAGTIASTPVGPSGSAKIQSAGNLVIATGDQGTDNRIVFAAGGYATGNTQMQILPDEMVHVEIATNSTSPNTGALVVAGGVGITGDTYTDGNVVLDGVLYVGPAAPAFETSAGLTAPAQVTTVTGPASSFAQIAFTNKTATSSTDFILYMNNGNDSKGWVGMGITGSAFDDQTYGITGPGDAYIFHDTLSNTYKGNLVLATGNSGSENKIVFAAGGYASGNTQMTITPNQNVKINIATPSTSPTTGAFQVVGGVGILGDMNIQGSVNVQGTITFGGSGTTVSTSNLSVTDPFVFVGTNNQADIIDLAFIGEYATTVSAITRSVSNKALTSNVATLTTSAAHTYLAGDVVTITGVDATFNGTYNIIAVPTSTTFTYAKTASNVSSTAVSPVGTAVVNARRKFSGVARDASDGIIKFFKDATTKPTTTINFSEAGLAYADIQVNALNAASATIGNVSNTELQYLDGVTSGIQSQIDGKASKSGDSFSGAVAINGSSAAAKQLIVKGAASQSANVLEVQNSSSTTVLSVDVAGNVSGTSFTSSNNSFFNNLRLNGGNSSDTIYLASGDIGISAAGANAIKLNTNNTTRITVASDGRVSLPAGGVLEAPAVTRVVTGTTDTLVLADAGKVVEFSNASATTVTVPTEASVAYPVGTRIDLLQTGAGQVTVVGNGFTVNGTGTKLRTTWSSATLLKRSGTNNWVLIGDIL